MEQTQNSFMKDLIYLYQNIKIKPSSVSFAKVPGTTVRGKFENNYQVISQSKFIGLTFLYFQLYLIF